MAAGFREGFVEVTGFVSGIWRRGKGRQSQARERLQSARLARCPRPREGPLTEPTADAQLLPRESVLMPLIGPTSIATKSAGWGKIGILDSEQTARPADQVAYRNIEPNNPERASYSTFGLVSAGTR